MLDDKVADVTDILSRYQQEVGEIALPIDEKILITVVEDLKHIDIEIVEKRRTFVGSNEGIVVPKKGGFILQYGLGSWKNGTRYFNPSARRRFTVCHELAHILFYDCSRVIPRKGGTPKEHECHAIARQLLLPEICMERKLAEECNPNKRMIPFLREFSRQANVALYPLVIRLTEDLSLLENVMITFWEYSRDHNINKICYRDFRKDAKLCPQLKKFLPRYWRNIVHMKVWDEIVRETVYEGSGLYSPKNLYVRGKRRVKGKVRSFYFKVECETLMETVAGQRSLLRWTNQGSKALSVQKFIRVFSK